MLFELDPNIAIRATNLGKCYQRYNKPIDRLKQAILRKRHYFEEVWVLRDISFELKRGKALGVIGRNGAGKSTLLQILSGTLTPTTGEVYLRGKMAALLELGSGFNPEFSGRDNIYVNGAILGLSRNQIDERFDEIVAFSELGEHIEQPVKTYSSGMHVRLAFSVQVCVKPDILIVDEALAVGDVFFQQKCHARMEKLLDQGTSILLVSHDTSSIRKYCDTALFLVDGHNAFYGDVEIAVSKFLFQRSRKLENINPTSEGLEAGNSAQNTAKSLLKDDNFCFDTAHTVNDIPSGSLLDKWPDPSEFTDLTGKEIVGDENSARFTSVALCAEDGLRRDHFQQGEWAYFFWEVELLRDFEVPISGLTIFSSSNLPIFCRGILPSTKEPLAPALKGNSVKFCAAIKTNIATGDYIIKLSLAQMRVDDYKKVERLSSVEYVNSTRPCIQLPKAMSVNIRENEKSNQLPFFGLVDLPNFFDAIIQQPNN